MKPIAGGGVRPHQRRADNSTVGEGENIPDVFRIHTSSHDQRFPKLHGVDLLEVPLRLGVVFPRQDQPVSAHSVRPSGSVRNRDIAHRRTLPIVNIRKDPNLRTQSRPIANHIRPHASPKSLRFQHDSREDLLPDEFRAGGMGNGDGRFGVVGLYNNADMQLRQFPPYQP